jgi:signal transduction histidine kinase
MLENINSANRRILVIDDNHAIHDDFRKILCGGQNGDALAEQEAELFGEPSAKACAARFQIDSAMQGREGLERVERAVAAGEPYAMAFVDVRMPPGWDGIETTAKIWEVSPDLQVVICTAYSDYSWDDMIAKVGQSDRLVILKKPFDNVEVLQLANAMTAKWELLQHSKNKVEDLEHIIAERTAALRESEKHYREMAENMLRAEEERKRMEVQLRHAQKMESIGQLAAGIAHEINTPMQYIGDNTRFVKDAFADLNAVLQSQGELLQAAKAGNVSADLIARVEGAIQKADLEYLAGEIPNAIEQSLDGIERVAKIVRAMKEFSHPGTTEKTQVDLNHAIDSTLTVCRNEWKYVAEVVTEFDPNLPQVQCLPGEINQTILNIVVNAAHAIGDVARNGSGTKGTITVSTKRQGDWAEIRICDTGTGIPEPARGRVFDPFFTTKGVGKGTGQGVAIAHSVIVDKHGGTISFETETGKGTTFIIRLPLVSPAKGREQKNE